MTLHGLAAPVIKGSASDPCPLTEVRPFPGGEVVCKNRLTRVESETPLTLR